MILKYCSYCKEVYNICYDLDIQYTDIFLIDGDPGNQNNLNINICYQCFNVIDEESNDYGCKYCHQLFKSKPLLINHIENCKYSKPREPMIKEEKNLKIIKIKRKLKLDKNKIPIHLPNIKIVESYLKHKNITSPRTLLESINENESTEEKK
jgi:hypothetical protein